MTQRGKTNQQHQAHLKLAVLCAFLSSIIAFTCIGVAIYLSPWFSFTTSLLSDLGSSAGEKSLWSSKGVVSIVFNFGLAIAGIIGMVFAVSVRPVQLINNRFGRFGMIFLLLDMFALSAIGIFPGTTGQMHLVASLSFFFLVPLSMLFIGVAARGSAQGSLGWFSIVLGIISLSLFPFLFIPQPWGSNAVVELIPSVLLSAFAIVFALYFLLAEFKKKESKKESSKNINI
jgi:hypothetical membrane protein